MREEILLVGGGSKSPSWRQIYADIFGKPMLKSRVGQDAASLGAAALAAVGTKFWPSLETIKKAHGDMESSLSNPETRELYAHGYERFLALRNTMAAFPAFFM
jgi:sugar (pentulose or hexulose) kinase